MSGRGAIEVINQEAPTLCIKLPKFDTRLAIQMARKIRCWKGARVAERDVSGGAGARAPTCSGCSAAEPDSSDRNFDISEWSCRGGRPRELEGAVPPRSKHERHYTCCDQFAPMRRRSG